MIPLSIFVLYWAVNWGWYRTVLMDKVGEEGSVFDGVALAGVVVVVVSLGLLDGRLGDKDGVEVAGIVGLG